MKEMILTYLPFALEFLFTVIVVPVIVHKIKSIDFSSGIKKITKSNETLINSLKQQNETLTKCNEALRIELLEKMIKVQNDIKEKQIEIDKVLEEAKLKEVELEVLIRGREQK